MFVKSDEIPCLNPTDQRTNTKQSKPFYTIPKVRETLAVTLTCSKVVEKSPF